MGRGHFAASCYYKPPPYHTHQGPSCPNHMPIRAPLAQTTCPSGPLLPKLHAHQGPSCPNYMPIRAPLAQTTPTPIRLLLPPNHTHTTLAPLNHTHITLDASRGTNIQVCMSFDALGVALHYACTQYNQGGGG